MVMWAINIAAVTIYQTVIVAKFDYLNKKIKKFLQIKE